MKIAKNIKVYNYDYWKNILLNKTKEIGCTPKASELSRLKLPDSRWFLKHCENEKVTDYNSFLEYELNLKPRYFMSKEMATDIILKAYKEIGHSPNKKELNPCICESVIKRIWGTLNNMKRELDIEIIGENMQSKHIEFDELKKILLKTCTELICNDINKDTITTKDISNNCPLKFGTFDRIFKLNNTSVREFLESNGFKYQKEGQGYVYNFNDGEKTKSQFELEFSNKLREYGFEYNTDYFRDIRYKEFINDYNGLLDCDYELHINNKIIYIEIAGMLRDYKHKYKTPNLIPSKSKQKYAIKLNEKEKMFIDNNLEYYILFPSDLKDLDFLFLEILHIYKKGLI